MRIQYTNTQNFKGYDARPLKGFLMNCNHAGIATEMSAIGAKEGFKVFTVHGKKCAEGVLSHNRGTQTIWAQDIWTLLPTNMLFKNKSEHTKAILSRFNLVPNKTQNDLREFEGCCVSLKENIEQKNREIKDCSRLIDFPLGDLKKKIQEKKALEQNLVDLHEDIHIAGGNLFITQGDNGDEVLVGADEVGVFPPEEIQEMYSVSKVIPVPQMDYHIDLFIRPLDNKRILLTDDQKTLEVFEKGIKKMQSYILSLPKEEQAQYKVISQSMLNRYKDFKKSIRENERPQSQEVASVLKEKGYEVIRVPGRFYEVADDPVYDGDKILQHHFNYMNANLTKNSDGDIVYITNKSNFDKKLGLTPELSEKIGFSFEEEFINSISPYVKKEHIYFVEGQDDYVSEIMLWNAQGGIHCACSEIPEGIG